MSAQPVEPAAILSSVGLEVRQDMSDGSRSYTDPVTDEVYLSVTTAIGATTSKPWLTRWAAKLAAECAVDNLGVVQAIMDASGRDAAVDYLKGEAGRKRDEASGRGTWLHDIVEALVLDATLPEFPDDPVATAMADAFVDWHCEWNPTYLLSECTVANPSRGYAGTADLGVYLPALDRTFLLDTKTGANLDLHMPVQLAAYARATECWLPWGRKARMPQFDGIGILHVRPEGCKFIDVTDQAGDEAFGVFLRMLEQVAWRDRQPKHLGRVLYPPLPDGSQPPPLVEDVGGFPCAAILAAAGLVRVDHVADAGAEKLLSLSGIGPKKLDGIREALALLGLALDGDL